MSHVQAALLCSCLVLASTPVSAAGCGKMPVLSATDPSGGRIELVLDSDSIEQTPQWTLEKGEPPLSVAKAASLAKKWRKENYKDMSDAEVRQISLTSLGCSSMNGHWYYVVEFLPKVNSVPRFEPGNWVAVLFDGTVVGPTKLAATK